MNDLGLFGVGCAVTAVAAWFYFQQQSNVVIPTIDNCTWKGKRFVVICNPIGGKQSGRSIVNDIIKPMCQQNEVTVDVLYTERFKHASEMAATLEFGKYDAILIVSGDGLIHEFLNGLSGGKPLSTDEYLKLVKKLPPIGTIPAGTSNGTATHLLSSDPLKAMVKVMQGQRRMVDTFHVVSDGPIKFVEDSKHAANKVSSIDVWDVHFFSWAILAEADQVMERMRWAPKPLREPFAAMWLIYQRRVYTGRIFITPAVPSAESAKEGCYREPETLPLVTEGPHKGRRVLEGTFLLVTGANMSDATFDIRMAPGARGDDGAIDLLIIRGSATRWQLLQAFLDLNGNHLKFPWCEVYKVSSFSLEPLDGVLNVSGEFYPCADVSVTVHSKATAFISSGEPFK
jgi:sphingosine kinase